MLGTLKLRHARKIEGERCATQEYPKCFNDFAKQLASCIDEFPLRR